MMKLLFLLGIRPLLFLPTLIQHAGISLHRLVRSDADQRIPTVILNDSDGNL